MNKHILLVMKWLDNPESVSKEEMKKNSADAYAYAAYAATAAYAARIADAAADAHAYAHAYAAADAQKWVNKYFDRTKENKQDYIDSVKGKAKMTTQILDINLEINGVDTDATIKVFFEAGQEAITNRDPNECQEGVDDCFELYELNIEFHIDNNPIKKHRDMSALLDIPDVRETIVEQVQEHINAEILSRQEPDAPEFYPYD